MPATKIIPPGTRFHRLVVLADGGFRENTNGVMARTSICLCDCGQVGVFYGSALRYGAVKACGCLKRQSRGEKQRASVTKHGHAATRDKKVSPTYCSWHAMNCRCRQKNGTGSHIYYGLEIDPRWDRRQGGSFENFLEDMGERPEGMTLDRKNGQLGYLKGNCKWSNRLEQARNTARAYSQEYVEQIFDLWEAKNGSMTQREFCKEIGLNAGTFSTWKTTRAAHRTGQKRIPKKKHTPDESTTIAASRES